MAIIKGKGTKIGRAGSGNTMHVPTAAVQQGSCHTQTEVGSVSWAKHIVGFGLLMCFLLDKTDIE